MRQTMNLAVSLVALAIAAPSSAAIYTLTYSGTISGVYQEGAANPASGFLDGQTYVVAYTIDTANGWRQASPGSDVLYGGPEDGAVLPVTTVFTVNGIEQTAFANSVYSEANIANGVLELTSEAIHSSDAISDSAFAVSISSNLSVLYTNLDVMPQGILPSSSSGIFEYYVYDDVNDAYVTLAQGNLDVSSVSVSDAVPEPASWTMMIAGFGLVGATARRRIVMAP